MEKVADLEAVEAPKSAFDATFVATMKVPVQQGGRFFQEKETSLEDAKAAFIQYLENTYGAEDIQIISFVAVDPNSDPIEAPEATDTKPTLN